MEKENAAQNVRRYECLVLYHKLAIKSSNIEIYLMISTLLFTRV